MGMVGKEALRAVNLARSLQGLGWVGVPPAPVTVASSDVVLLRPGNLPPAPVWPLLTHANVTWTRGAGALGPAHVLMCWGGPGLGCGVGVAYPRGVSWLGSFAIVPGVVVCIDGVLIGRPLVAPGALVNFVLGIAELGLPAFVLVRAALRNKGE
jgi:hypothetical protein